MEKNSKLSKPLVVFLAALVCCFLWGSATPAIKTGYRLFGIQSSDTASIILFAGIRFFLAGVLIILFQSVRGKRLLRPEKGSFKAILAISLLQTVIQYFFFYVGLAHTSGVTTTIITGSSSFFSILLAALLFKMEKLTPRKLLGCILGFAGIVVMNLSPGSSTVFHFAIDGEMLILLSSLSYAFSGIMIKKYSDRFSVVMLSAYQFVLGGAIMILIARAAGGWVSYRVGFPAYILLLYLAFISAMAYSLWGLLLENNPVSKVTIYFFLTPLWGVLLSAIFLGEVSQALEVTKLFALVLVSLGIYVVNSGKE